MGSEQSWNGAESHRLCANGCGFFGTAATLNLCSKCYRDFRIKEEQEAKAKAAVEKSLNPQQPETLSHHQKSIVASVESALVVGSSASITTSSASVVVSGGVEGNSGGKNRCLCCKKRVGLTGFKCRCGSMFCSIHRYPEKHDCSFDFKGSGRDAIAKANPVVKADKVERI